MNYAKPCLTRRKKSIYYSLCNLRGLSYMSLFKNQTVYLKTPSYNKTRLRHAQIIEDKNRYHHLQTVQILFDTRT